MRKGPWEINSTKQVYKDDFVELNVDDVVGPDDEPGTYAVVEVKPGVAVLAFDSENQVYLTKQFRYALNADSVEVVSGGIDEGLQPLEAAKKELQE
jgi:ADP-ribose pyrophosphatase